MKNKKIVAAVVTASVVTNIVPIGTISAYTKKTAQDIIISEYIEGSSNNKAIELYNGTGSTIDLGKYKLELYSNGKEESPYVLDLSGELENNKTYVIAHDKANNDIKDKANLINSTTINFNGDDAVVLKKGEDIVDSLGQVGVDPGDEWKVNDVSTKDMTLVRKADVLSGDTDASNEFDPSAEWIALPKDDTSNLGKHTMNIDVEGENEDVEGLISIKEARNAEADITIKGKVTFKELSGNLYNYAIEDETAGIALRGVDGLNVGDEVIVKGSVSEYKGLKQVTPFDIIENKGEKPSPEPKLLTISQIVENSGGEEFESQLVKLENLTVESINLSGNTKLVDENGKYINLYKAIDLGDTKEGDKVEVTATLSQFSNTGTDGYQLRINDKSQVKVVNEGSEEPEIPDEDKEGPTFSKVTPASSSNIGSNKTPEISATFEDKTGVDMNSATMSIDGVDVTSNLVKEGNTIKYTVTEDLSDGKHIVKVDVSDTLGNTSSKEWSFTVGIVKQDLYFGQLHSHTNISDGQGSVDDAYTHAKDKAQLDFFAVTDHSNWFDNDTKGSMADGSASSEWKLGNDTADKYNEDNEFTAIYGYEMTWTKQDGGHINTFNTPGFETRSNSSMKLQQYYNTLKQFPESVSQFNHPGTTFGNFFDYAYYDEEIDERISLIEVGNGEGAIGGSGYFPSYDQYTLALDKGWHVAPTNNQDNHKGLWGNANTARTVVQASSNTREGIYEALEARRTYATEDENLEISYTVNGNTMGSILDETDTLSFSIKVNDNDSGDNIKSIKIIGDGGKIIKQIDNVDSSTKEWNFTLDSSNSSYYYVRVDQSDKDIAVTAPVWVGEKELVGLDSINTDKDIIVEGEEFNLETTIYNNESKELENVKIEYYINGSEEAIVKDVENVKSGESVVVKLPYSFEKAGDYSVEIKVTGTINGAEKIFNSKTNIEIVKSEQVSRVLIDGSHDNGYVTGYYADNMNSISKVATSKGMKLDINMSQINDELLNSVDLLILSDPATGKNYSDSELASIKKYVDNGGDLVMTTLADYKDASGENGNAAQGNAVLEAVGAKLRFNDDQVVDDDDNGGQPYRVYLNNYNLDSKFTKDIDTNITYSFYSGASIIMPKDMNNVEAIVKGHDTTYTSDADGSGDNTPVNKGEVVVLASETLESGSTVILGGNTFFSDFEMKENEYSNYHIMENILDNLAPVPEVKVSNIADVRVDEDKDNMPDRFGEKVVVEGYVTAASNASAPGNSFFDVIYIQDETGGVTVFGVSNKEVKLGQKVKLTGKIGTYLGDAQIVVTNEDTQLEIIDENINLVKPIDLSTKDSMLEEKEGLLVKVSGTVTKVEGQDIFVNDGSGEARVYTEGYIGNSTVPDVADEWKSRVSVGDKISAIGLASEDPEGHRLRVRDSAEIVVIENGEQDTVDKDYLGDLIDTVANIDKGKYTEESIATLEDALEFAKEVFSNIDSTPEQVKEAYTRLKSAIDGLVEYIEVNKRSLTIAVEEALKITEAELDKVVPVVVKEFKAALKQAQEILDNEKATQIEVDASFERLSSVMHKLSFEKGDKKELQDLIDRINSLVENEYIPSTWKKLQTSLKAAKGVIADENALQEEVKETYTSLMRAFLDLRLKPNKEKLEGLINKAENLDKDKYTQESYAKVELALKSARIVFANQEAVEEEVTEEVNRLELALNTLVAKSDESGATDDEDSDNNNDNNNSSENNNSSDKESNPSTGDAGLGFMGLITPLLSAAGIFILGKKRK
ncbi:MAG: CehA/McbA family metallohydrolase [Peptostreptococcaceae bacterium]